MVPKGGGGGKKRKGHEIIDCIPRISHILWEKQNKAYLKQNSISKL
jgi:hypothetical protein